MPHKRPVNDEQHQAMMRLAGTIQMLRRQRGWSLREMAAEADLEHSFLFRLENANTDHPSLFLIQKLAKALDLSVDELMNFDAKPCPTCGGSGWVNTNQ